MVQCKMVVHPYFDVLELGLNILRRAISHVSRNTESENPQLPTGVLNLADAIDFPRMAARPTPLLSPSCLINTGNDRIT